MADLLDQVHAQQTGGDLLDQVHAQATAAAAPKTDDDIIRANGFDPAVVKSSHLYVPGHLVSVATDSAPHGTDFAGTAAKGLDEMGQGVYNVPAGLFQFAVHAANKLGIASDADVQYNDLLEKVHRQAYLARVGADHSIIPELAGGALIPIPGGAAKTLLGALAKGAAVGAGAALAQPATNVAPGADYFAPKATQTAIGAATGGAAGALTGGVARVLSSRSVELPEQLAARAQTGGQRQVSNLETAMQTTPVTETAEQLAARARTGGTQQVSNLETAMQTTPFAGAADVEKAASGGDRAAIALRDQMAAAQTPGQILQASIGLQNWRTRATATGLYDKVQQLVKGHPQLADVPLDQTEQTITDALNQAEKAKDPDVNLISQLKTFQRTIGASSDPVASDELVDNSYGQIRKFRSDLGERVSTMRTGAGKQLAGPSSAAVLQTVRNAVDEDLRNFTANSGAPDVQRAADAADKYYAQVRVPFTASDVSKAGAPNLAGTTTDAEADQIFNKFIQAGKGDKAQRFFNSLDPRGRAAVQYQMTADAMNKAIDPLTGSFEPSTFFNALDKTKEAYGVFFTGPAKAQMDGLKNLAQQAVSAQGKDAALRSALTKGGGATTAEAQGLFDALDARGRAVVRHQIAADAVNKATEPLTGAFDSTKFFNALDKTKEAQGVFFQGPDKAAMDGLKSLAQQAGLSAAKEAALKTKLNTIGAAGAIATTLVHGVGAPAAVTAPISALGLLAASARGLMLSDAGRRLLADASSLKPGDPRLAAILDTVSRQFPATGARVAAPAQ